MSSKPPSPANKAAERLAVIVDAAERAALAVIDDAEKEAGRYLEEARAKADRIVAEKLRETADLLEVGDSGAAPPAEQQPALAAVADEAGGGSAAARLVATEMAVSGSSRKEIEKRLRNGFEIEDTNSILDAILGPEE